MQLIKCYKIMNYQKRFLDLQTESTMSFSRSETVRHAATLLLTVITKRGYLPGGIFLEDMRGKDSLIQISSKFPNQLFNEILKAMDLYHLTFAAYIRIALDIWIAWHTGTLTPEQESYILKQEQIIA